MKIKSYKCNKSFVQRSKMRALIEDAHKGNHLLFEKNGCRKFHTFYFYQWKHEICGNCT